MRCDFRSSDLLQLELLLIKTSRLVDHRGAARDPIPPCPSAFSSRKKTSLALPARLRAASRRRSRRTEFVTMNTLTSSISKMMQRPQPAPVPAKPSDPTPESSQPVVDSDRTTSDAEIAAMQPSMSYASRVPPQNQGQTQVGTGDTPKMNGPTLLRRPILQRGSSGPSAPEGQAGGPVRPGARSLGPAAGAAQTQQAPPGMAGLAGADGGDGLGGALPKAKVSTHLRARISLQSPCPDLSA